MLTTYTLLLISAFLLCSTSKPLSRIFSSSDRLDTVRIPLLRTYATINGQPTLNQAFQVLVDLSDDSDYASDSDMSPHSATMMLALYSNQTFLPTNCLGFSNFNCLDSAQCQPNPTNLTNITFPYFTAQVSTATPNIYVDYTYWALTADAFIPSSCNSNGSSTYGAGTQGIIGLGFQGNAASNFHVSPVFSIYLDEEEENSQIDFNPDISDGKLNFITSLSVDKDSDWQVRGVDNFQVGSYDIPANANLIFDLNADAIGLPMDLYNQVLSTLANYQVNCSNNSYYLPVCSYEGTVADLPLFSIQAGNQSVPIPPEVYVNGGEDEGRSTDGEIVLNLKALSISLSGNSYVTPGFENYIILDYHVMVFYFTVFDGTNYTINLYQISGSSNIVISIILVVTAGALLFCCLCYRKQIRDKIFAKRKSKADENYLFEGFAPQQQKDFVDDRPDTLDL